MKYLVVYLVIAHLVGDFIFQTDGTCKKKEEAYLTSWYSYIHCAVIICLSWIATFSLYGWWLALLLGISHFLVDWAKSAIDKSYLTKEKEKYRLFSYLLDQVAHLTLIVGVAKVWLCFNIEIIVGVNVSMAYFLWPIAFLLCFKPANILTTLLMNFHSVSNFTSAAEEGTATQDDSATPAGAATSDGTVAQEDHGNFHSGALIGTMERFIILLLVMIGQYEAIGFLITAKSILRFHSVEESEKSEYVVAGTFISYFIALLLGLSIKWFF